MKLNLCLFTVMKGNTLISFKITILPAYVLGISAVSVTSPVFNLLHIPGQTTEPESYGLCGPHLCLYYITSRVCARLLGEGGGAAGVAGLAATPPQLHARWVADNDPCVRHSTAATTGRTRWGIQSTFQLCTETFHLPCLDRPALLVCRKQPGTAWQTKDTSQMLWIGEYLTEDKRISELYAFLSQII